MANQVEIQITADPKGAEAGFKQTQSAFGRMASGIARHRKAIGVGMTAIGGAITGIAALAIKSSLEQQVGINRLDQALKNVGQSYDGQRDAIERVIEAQQRKTNFGDEAQRDALQKLVVIGGKWAGSLEALKVTTDVAAGANIDLNAAALLVGKAIAGETSSLSRYGITLEKGATQTEIMAALTRQFGGAAEAAADPMTQMKNRMGDMLQVLGDALLPIMERASVLIEKVTRKFIAWTEEHPTLTKVLGITAAAIGAVALVVGPLLLLLPTIVAAVGLLSAAFGTLSIAMGPITAIVLGIAAAITAGIVIYKNWDVIMQKLEDHWKIILPILVVALGPIGMLTAAIAAGILIWKNWDVVVQKVKETLGTFAKFVIDVGIKIAKGAKAMLGWMKGLGGIKDGLDEAILSLEGMKDGLDDWVDTAGFAATQTAKSFSEIGGNVDFWNEGIETSFDTMATGVGASLDSVAGALVHAGVVWEEVARENLRRQRGEVDEMDTLHRISAQMAQDAADEIAATNDKFWATVLRQNQMGRRDEVDEMETLAFTKITIAKNVAAEIIATEKTKNAELARERLREAAALDRLQARNSETARSIIFNASNQGKAWRELGGNVESVVLAINKVTGESVAEILKGFEEEALAGETLTDTLLRLGEEGEISFMKLARQMGILDKMFGDGTDSAEGLANAIGNIVTETELLADANRRQRAADARAGGGGLGDDAVWGPYLTKKLQEGRQMRMARDMTDFLSNLGIENVAADMLGATAAAAGYAHGGPIGAGQMAIVGERGPELFRPNTAGTIIPNGGGGIGGGVSINLTVNGDVHGMDDFEDKVSSIIRDAVLRGGFSGVLARA